MTKIDRLESPPPLLLEPDFSFLAVKAADELEQHSAGQETTFEATRKVGEMLKRSIRSAEIMGEGGHSKRLNLITPTMAGVYHQAFDAIPDQEDADLPKKTEDISTTLQGADAGMSQAQATQLRDFCIALAQNALGTLEMHARY